MKTMKNLIESFNRETVVVFTRSGEGLTRIFIDILYNSAFQMKKSTSLCTFGIDTTEIRDLLLLRHVAEKEGRFLSPFDLLKTSAESEPILTLRYREVVDNKYYRLNSYPGRVVNFNDWFSDISTQSDVVLIDSATSINLNAPWDLKEKLQHLVRCCELTNCTSFIGAETGPQLDDIKSLTSHYKNTIVVERGEDDELVMTVRRGDIVESYSLQYEPCSCFIRLIQREGDYVGCGV